MPDYSSLGKTPQYDWMSSVYCNVTEELPNDAPASLGKEVTITTYVDANLYHDWTTGRAVTGTLNFLNGTPIDWFSKCQNTAETNHTVLSLSQEGSRRTGSFICV